MLKAHGVLLINKNDIANRFRSGYRFRSEEEKDILLHRELNYPHFIILFTGNHFECVNGVISLSPDLEHNKQFWKKLIKTLLPEHPQDHKRVGVKQL